MDLLIFFFFALMILMTSPVIGLVVAVIYHTIDRVKEYFPPTVDYTTAPYELLAEIHGHETAMEILSARGAFYTDKPEDEADDPDSDTDALLVDLTDSRYVR